MTHAIPNMLEETMKFVPLIRSTADGALDAVFFTAPYLDTCRQVLPVLENLGAGLGVIRSDVSGNIERLQKRYDTDPNRFQHLLAIVREEKSRHVEADNHGCTKGLLWLNRSMLLVLRLLRAVAAGESPYDAASAAYDVTLRPYHGYLTFGAFKMAIQFAPGSREDFLHRLGAPAVEDESHAEIDALLLAFEPICLKLVQLLEAEGCNYPDRV